MQINKIPVQGMDNAYVEDRYVQDSTRCFRMLRLFINNRLVETQAFASNTMFPTGQVEAVKGRTSTFQNQPVKQIDVSDYDKFLVVIFDEEFEQICPMEAMFLQIQTSKKRYRMLPMTSDPSNTPEAERQWKIQQSTPFSEWHLWGITAAGGEYGDQFSTVLDRKREKLIRDLDATVEDLRMIRDGLPRTSKTQNLKILISNPAMVFCAFCFGVEIGYLIWGSRW